MKLLFVVPAFSEAASLPPVVERKARRSSITPHRSVYYMAKIRLSIGIGASRGAVRRPAE